MRRTLLVASALAGVAAVAAAAVAVTLAMVPDPAAPPVSAEIAGGWPKPCQDGDLAVSMSEHRPTAEDGDTQETATLLIAGTRPGGRCTIIGYPSDVAVDQDRRQVDSGLSYPVVPVTVEGTEARAEIELRWYPAVPGEQDGPVVTPSELTLRLPGTSQLVAVAWSGGPVDPVEEVTTYEYGPVTAVGGGSG
jgi:hypothetical protein